MTIRHRGITLIDTMTRRRPGRPKSPESKEVLHIEVPASLKKAIGKSAAQNGRTITGEVLLVLKGHYNTLGLWSPDDAG